MFSDCSSLTSVVLSNLDTSNVVEMSRAFADCSSLTSVVLSNLDTSKLKEIVCMFTGCKKLTFLNLSGWDVSNVTSSASQFFNCNSLTTVLGPINGIKNDLELRHSPLTADSAMVFINGLASVESAKTIKFKSTTYDQLTLEQIAIATSKGWNVVRS